MNGATYNLKNHMKDKSRKHETTKARKGADGFAFCPSFVISNFRAFVICLSFVFTANASINVNADELHSNGVGGGDWSEPTSWREKRIPGPMDDAVISRGDVIVFDRNDESQVTCHQLFIDPQGALTFKSGEGRLTCTLSGAIESYGIIKLDGSKTASDRFELKFVGEPADSRQIKLLKGSTLSMNGRRNLAHGKHNVCITATTRKDSPLTSHVSVLAVAGVSVDLQRGEFFNVYLNAGSIDNTGGKPHERLNIADNHFTGLSYLFLGNCDSAAIIGNRFTLSEITAFGQSALYLASSPLSEVRGNEFVGRYAMGIQARPANDSAFIDNTFEKCVVGLYWHGTNGMLQRLKFEQCDTGIVMTTSSAVGENLEIKNCGIGLHTVLATVQLTNLRISDVPEKGKPIEYASGAITLLNCNLTPDDIKILPKQPPKKLDGVPPVDCL